MTTFLFLEFDVIGHSILRKFKGSHFKTKQRGFFVQILPYIMGDTSLACEVPKVHINLSLFVLYIQKLNLKQTTEQQFQQQSQLAHGLDFGQRSNKVYASFFSSYFYQLGRHACIYLHPTHPVVLLNLKQNPTSSTCTFLLLLWFRCKDLARPNFSYIVMYIPGGARLYIYSQVAHVTHPFCCSVLKKSTAGYSTVQYTETAAAASLLSSWPMDASRSGSLE